MIALVDLSATKAAVGLAVPIGRIGGLLRQLRFRQGNAVLHVHLVDVAVGATV